MTSLHPCADCGMPIGIGGTRCRDCYTTSAPYRSCAWCGIKTASKQGVCAACKVIDKIPEPTAAEAFRGTTVRRGLISVFIPADAQPRALSRVKPFAPGLTCWMCCGDPSTGYARRTPEGWRHADATECVRVLAEERGVVVTASSARTGVAA